MNLRVESIYDSGTATILEDRLIIRPPFYGVLDGVSGLYHPDEGPRLFDGFSGGQKVAQLISNAVVSASPKDSVEKVMLTANRLIREFIRAHNIDDTRGDLLPGATFAFAKIGKSKVEIIQGGDCFAAWRAVKGKEVVATSNQNFAHEKLLLETLGRILKKYKGNRAKTWSEYIPIAASRRIESLNKKSEASHVLLNGTRGVEKLWNKFILPRNKIDTILLFTDGLVTFQETKDEQRMGRMISDLYQRKGWRAVLARIRRLELKRGALRHIDYAEATGIAIHL